MTDITRDFPVPSDEEVISALDSTGFIFEQKVAQAFLRHDRFEEVVINHSFRDSETGKSREVDVSVSYSNCVGDWRRCDPLVLAEIVVECKNTSNPFVLIGSDNPVTISLNSYYSSSFDPLSLGFKRLISTPFRLKFHELPGSFREDKFVGTQLVRLNLQHGKWKADNNGVFDGIVYPLAKASRAALKGHRPEDDEPGSPCFTFLYPLLVTNGPLYCVTVSAGSSVVHRARWARLVRQLDEEHLEGTHIVDVVQFECLNDYIERRVLGFLSAVEKKLSDNTHCFDPKWLLANYGKPKKIEIFDEWAREVSRRRT